LQNTKQIPGTISEKSGSKIDTDLGAKKVTGAFEGLPYRGKPIIVRESDPESKQPKLIYEGHAGVFNMSLKDNLEEYSKLMDREVRGLITIGQKRIVYDRDLKNYIVFLEWAEQFYTSPEE